MNSKRKLKFKGYSGNLFRSNQIKSKIKPLFHGLADKKKANTESMHNIDYEHLIPGSSPCN